MQSLSQFEISWNGKFTSFGSTVQNQCFSVAQLWAQNFGYPLFWGNAIDLINENPGNDWVRVAPSQLQPGDLVIFGQDAGIGTGPYGHVGIYVRPSGAGFVVFNQNAPVGHPCQEFTFWSLEGVLGGLRPKALISNVPTPPPAPAPQGDTWPQWVPVNQTVNITSTTLNVRTAPLMSAPVAAQYHGGTAHITGWCHGDNGTVGTRTSNVWVRSDGGHWANAAGTNFSV